MNQISTTTKAKPPAVPTPELSEMLRRFTAALQRETNPLHFSISDRKAPDAGQREVLIRRRDEIEAAISIPATKQEIGRLIAAMMVNFAPIRRSEQEADALLAAYCKQLSEFPSWIISEACDGFCKGRAADKDFAPLPPKLADACRSILYRYKGAAYDIDKILNAHVYHEPTPEEQARISEGFAALLREMQGQDQREGKEAA